MYALLVAEDPDERAIFSTILQRVGIAVTTASDLQRAIQTWVERPADLIFIAVYNQDPCDQIHRVRAETIVPLIVAVHRLDEVVHYDLLKQGADLIVPPSFNPKLLIAQIGVLMRRTSSVPVHSLPSLNAPNFVLSPETRTVEIDGKSKKRLTHLEFRMLYTLMMNRGHIIPTETIVERVWGYTGQGDRDLIRGLVSRLRAKVEVDARNPQYILTHPGIGYSFKADEE